MQVCISSVYIYIAENRYTCIDTCSSALASGAGTAFDSLEPFLEDSTPLPFPPAAFCLKSYRIMVQVRIKEKIP